MTHAMSSLLPPCWLASSPCTEAGAPACSLSLPPNTTIIFPVLQSGLLGISAALLSLLGTLANSLLICGLLASPRIRGLVTTPFILSVLVSDLLFSLLLLPTQAARFLSRDWSRALGPEEGPLCQAYPLLLYTVQGATVLSLTCVSLNRAAVLYWGLSAESVFRRFLTPLLLVLCWLLPLVNLLPSLAGAYGKVTLKRYTQTCTIVSLQENGSDPKRILYFFFFFPALVLLVASNIFTLVRVKAVVGAITQRLDKRRENMFVTMLCLSFLTWLLSVGPFILVDSLLDPCFQRPGLHAMAYIINWTKVVANPAIFLLMDRGFLRAVRSLVRRMTCRKAEEESEARDVTISGYHSRRSRESR